MQNIDTNINCGGVESQCFGSFAVLLTDDESASMSLPVDFGHVFISSPSAGANGLVWLRGSSAVKYAGGNSFAVIVNTELSGTTGEDEKLTVSTANSMFYIENRTGAEQKIVITFIGLGASRI